MEAVMDSSSPYLKSVSCRDINMGFLGLRDDFTGKAVSRSPLHRWCGNKNKDVDLKLSLSFSSTRPVVRPISLSSSHTQAEVINHELQLEERPNGYTNEAEAQTVHVKLRLQHECSFGQNFLIVGDDPMLGLWDPNNAIPLSWSDGHAWSVDLDIPIGKCIKFKFVMQESNGKFVWQPGPDRILEFQRTEKTITLCEDWETPDSRRIIDADPRLNQVEESAVTPEIQFVADKFGVPVEPSVTASNTPNEEAIEPKGYVINLKEVLVSDEGVPVLVPGLTPLRTMGKAQEGSVGEAPKDEAESMNGAAMAPAGAEAAQDLKLPELDSKGDANTSMNLNQRMIDQNQDACENEHQETRQQPVEEHDHQTSLLVNDIQWGKNVLQKLLNGFGFR